MKMNELKKATQVGQSQNSQQIKACIAHQDMQASSIGLDIGSKGISALMGKSWQEDAHKDVYDSDAGWVDKKAAPKQRRDLELDGRNEGDDPIMASYESEDG